MTSAALVDGFRRRREAVLERIATAARGVGRDPGTIQLVAVSKGFDADLVRLAVEAGLTTLGENRVQEAAAKIPAVTGATWHLVGPLQSNKARRALELFDRIESVDSLELAIRLGRIAGEIRPGRPLAVLLQVNVDADPAKAGFRPAALDAAASQLVAVAGLEIRGLMTVGRLVDRPEDARATFRALRSLSDTLRVTTADLGPELSMGMSDDYAIAIEEGATTVRIGRALFGERPSPG